ncbi:hypothetical protein SLS53_006930 [Cytospora paraplurivora]|uniref:Amino acid permease/ SLC12A domain-containing protein n=1 Tax=Cytospora paraplurivora TaxID=2898453 RepID=A0AAN9YEC6_9PEZI
MASTASKVRSMFKLESRATASSESNNDTSSIAVGEQVEIVTTPGPGPDTTTPGPGEQHTGLKEQITTRQFIFMALGGSIGAGLFIASSKGLQQGGPGSLFSAFAVVGLAVWLTMCALGELSASFPVQGSFYDFSVRFISPSWGFAMGWNYNINFMLIVPFEITVIILIERFWGADVPKVALVPVFILGLAAVHLFGARTYAEVERALGIAKILVLMAFVVTGIVIAAGGTREAGGRGFENWRHGQAFIHGGSGFISVFVAAGMAYGGTEMLGLTVAECKEPRRVMPLASTLVIGRLVICYLLPLFVVGLVLKPSAFQEPEFAHLHAVSPFVAGVAKARIKVLPHVINGFLIAAVFSMASSAFFASSRSLTAICRQGMGPRIFAKTTKNGLPRNSLIAVLVVAQLAWVTGAPDGDYVFEWLLALASTSNFFTGRTTNDLVWRAPTGIWGSYLAALIITTCLISLVVSASLPPVIPTSVENSEIVLMNILGFIVVFVCWTGHLLIQARKDHNKSWRERILVPLDQLDLSALDANHSPVGPEAETREGLSALHTDQFSGLSEAETKEKAEQV